MRYQNRWLGMEKWPLCCIALIIILNHDRGVTIVCIRHLILLPVTQLIPLWSHGAWQEHAANDLCACVFMGDEEAVDHFHEASKNIHFSAVKCSLASNIKPKIAYIGVINTVIYKCCIQQKFQLWRCDNVLYKYSHSSNSCGFWCVCV